MTLRQVLLVYALIGVACAATILRRDPRCAGRTLASAALALPLWPLWAPFALGDPASEDALGDGVLGRVRRGLDEARSAIAGTAFESCFSAAEASAILRDVTAIVARRDTTYRVLAHVEPRSAPAERLEQLVARDTERLDELTAMLSALRSELLVARALGERAEDDGATTLVRVSTLLAALRDGSATTRLALRTRTLRRGCRACA